METISFKVESAIAEELDNRAARQNGSRHTAARQIVLEALTDADRFKVLQEIVELKAQLEDVRNSLATAVVALLVQAGKVQQNEAKEWVLNNIMRQGISNVINR